MPSVDVEGLLQRRVAGALGEPVNRAASFSLVLEFRKRCLNCFSACPTLNIFSPAFDLKITHSLCCTSFRFCYLFPLVPGCQILCVLLPVLEGLFDT